MPLAPQAKSDMSILRLQARWNRIAQPIRVLGRPIFIINLHKLNFGELFECRHQQIRDCEIPAFQSAVANKINARDSIGNLQFAVTGESVIEGNPAIDKTLRGAGTFEVFVERGLRQHARGRPAHAIHFEGR